MVDQAAAGLRGKAVDVVLAVGGGSVLDAGKAIAAMLKENGSVVDFLEGVGKREPPRVNPCLWWRCPPHREPAARPPRMRSFPAWEAADSKNPCGTTTIFPGWPFWIRPCVSAAPPSVTAACGMDALTQLIESYVSTQSSPLDGCIGHGWHASPDTGASRCLWEGRFADTGCRGAVAYGAFLSGVTLANAGLGVVHGVAGPMGGMLSVPHGVACANLLPFAVKATVDNLAACIPNTPTPPSRNSPASANCSVPCTKTDWIAVVIWWTACTDGSINWPFPGWGNSA
jgi:alcohol dehydrogenase class IV